MNLIAEDVIDILQHQSNLSSPHRSIFVIDSSCFLKCFHQFFNIDQEGLSSRLKKGPVEVKMGCSFYF